MFCKFKIGLDFGYQVRDVNHNFAQHSRANVRLMGAQINDLGWSKHNLTWMVNIDFNHGQNILIENCNRLNDYSIIFIFALNALTRERGNFI